MEYKANYKKSHPDFGNSNTHQLIPYNREEKGRSDQDQREVPRQDPHHR